MGLIWGNDPKFPGGNRVTHVRIEAGDDMIREENNAAFELFSNAHFYASIIRETQPIFPVI